MTLGYQLEYAAIVLCARVVHRGRIELSMMHWIVSPGLVECIEHQFEGTQSKLPRPQRLIDILPCASCLVWVSEF